MSKIIKNCCVSYDSVPRVIGPKVKILKPHKKVDVGNILSNNALESADISLKKALRKAVDMNEQSRVQAEIAYAAAHKSGREHGHSEGLKKGKVDGFRQSEEKLNGTIDEFLAKAGSLDKNYKSKIEAVKDECIDFAFSLAENVLGSKIDREKPEFTDIKDSYLSAQPQKVLIEADGRVLELGTLKPDWLVKSAEGLSGITAELKEEKPVIQEENSKSLEDRHKPELSGKHKLEPKPAVEEISSEAPFLKKQTENKEKTNSEETNENHGTKVFEEAAVSTIKQSNVENKVNISEKKEKPIVFPNLKSAGSGNDDNYAVPDDKLVYIRPSIKPAALNSAENLKFEDLAQIKKENLKAILRKASAEEMTAALNGVPDEVSNVLLDACPRKTKEKVLDAIKYLGPVPETDVCKAQQKITGLAREYLKREE